MPIVPVTTITISADSTQDKQFAQLFKASASFRGDFCVVYSNNSLKQGEKIDLNDLSEVFGAVTLVCGHKVFEKDGAFTNKSPSGFTTPAQSKKDTVNPFSSQFFNYDAFKL